MTIRTPTSLVIDFNTDLKTEVADNKFAVHRFISNTLQLPLGSYSVGSIDITNADSDVFLGHAGVGIILSDKIIDITLGQSAPVTTKLFAYDGVKMPISVSTESTTPVTVEYVIGDKAPTVSDAPAITTVTPGAASATVAFTAPYSNGGSNITSYTVTSSPGGITATGSASPITVAGLTNGTAYTFTVFATNTIGNSAVSATSNTVTPSATDLVPDSPVITQVVPGVNQAAITFIAPDDNGHPILGYTVTAQPGGNYTNGTASPILFGELTSGESYTFTVTATNSVGISVASTPSDPVTIPDVPGAPTIYDLSMSGDEVTVYFNAPVSNGGSEITSYTVTSSPDGFEGVGATSPITVSGLTYGTEYTFTVCAENEVGTSLPSNVSDPELPSSSPAAPTITDATISFTTATISFTEPNDNGSPITEYVVITHPTNVPTPGSSSPINVTGLRGGSDYTFTVLAVNINGNGAQSASSPTLSAIATEPGIPTIDNIIPSSNSVDIYFTQDDDGGSNIIEWTVYDNLSSVTGTGTSSPFTVTGLTAGTNYAFYLVATNSVGTSGSSNTFNVTTTS